MRPTPLFALLVLAPLAQLTAQDQNTRAARDAATLADYQQARRSLDSGNYARAVPILESLLERDPNNGDLNYGLGLAYFRAGRSEEALTQLTTAFEKGSMGNTYSNAYRIAGLHAQLGAHEEALDWLQLAFELRHVDRPGVATDASFSSLSDNPRFRELAGLAPDRDPGREEAWRYDLDFLMSEIRRMHPKEGGHPDGGPIHSAIEALKPRVGELSDTQIAFELMKVIALLGDGHSGIRLTGSVDASFVPLDFYKFSDGLFVTRSDEAHEGLVGSKVLTIGGRDAVEVLKQMAVVVPHENDQGVIANGPFYLRSPDLMHYLGLNPDPSALHLEIQRPDGTKEEVQIAGEELQRFPRSRPPTDSPNDVPLYLSLPQSNFWMEHLEDLDAVYVQWNAVQDMPGKPLARFAEQLWGELQDLEVHNVIVDVRHNGGGNNFLTKPMIRTLVHFELEDLDNQVFVITSRHTYSACQNFLNRYEAVGEPIVVGEPSSSKPNFIGESTQVQLPFTGVRFGISSRYWQDSYPEDSRPWIAPHMPVELSSEDWFLNRDPAMAAIREFLGGR